MKTKQMVIETKHGLHLRMAGAIAKLAGANDCRLRLSCDGCHHADGCSVMQLLTLGAAQGTELEVQADGPDEDRVLKGLSDIFHDGAGI
jgi:phosphotransferase system HPr (HPr) family protein